MKLDTMIPGHRVDGMAAFVRVAHRRSFTAAARDPGISPSAVSQQVRALEDRIGAARLARAIRNVGLTQAGRILPSRAGPALAASSLVQQTRSW